MFWPYLRAESLSTRQAITAFLLRDMQTIVEIGGAPNPLSCYTSAHVLDVPRWQAWTADPQLLPKPYGVAILGMDLEDMSEPDWARLIALVDGADRCVVEAAEEYRIGMAQCNRVIEETALELQWSVKLHFVDPSLRPGGKHYPICPNRLLSLVEKPHA